jgi:hypothetical protein
MQKVKGLLRLEALMRMSKAKVRKLIHIALHHSTTHNHFFELFSQHQHARHSTFSRPVGAATQWY